MSTSPSDAAPSARSDAEHAFVSYLVSLARDDRRAPLAALRRGLGKRPGQVVEMFPHIVPWLSESMSPTRQADYFLVASLFASHQINWSVGEQGASGRYTNLGASFRRLNTVANSDSIEKRFVALLNAGREDLPLHLRHAVSLLKAHDIPVDWTRLLGDLAGWGADNRRVQREWARAFWRHDAPSASAAPDANGAERAESATQAS